MEPSLIKLMAWSLFVIFVLAIPATSSYIVPTARACTAPVADRLSCGNVRAHGNMYSRPACCEDTVIPFVEEGFCVDLDDDLDYCGSCSRRCSENEDCCHGICTNILGDRSNCGICGAKCTEDEFCKMIVDDPAVDPAGSPSCMPS